MATDDGAAGCNGLHGMHGRLGLALAVACAFSLAAQAQRSEVPSPIGTSAMGPGLGVVSTAARARIVLERDTVTGDGLVAVRIRVAAEGFTLASYQGAISFDAAEGVAIRTFTIPGEEEQNLLNLDAASPGVLRYAGFSARGFTVPLVDVGRVVFRAPSLERLHLAATLDVAGDPEGRSVPARQRVGASGIAAPTRAP